MDIHVILLDEKNLVREAILKNQIHLMLQFSQNPCLMHHNLLFGTCNYTKHLMRRGIKLVCLLIRVTFMTCHVALSIVVHTL